ncbi:hypothetical protein EJ110_NYTH35376 [Nymphaea thermarum]|nr:hypothetical protein EJ110_NYTH35376 [Nymphaea thermarum]
MAENNTNHASESATPDTSQTTGTLFKLIIAIIVILGIAALLIWLVLRHGHQVLRRRCVSDTVQLDQCEHSALQSQIECHSIRNPNKKIGIDYDELDVAAYYNGERFGWVQLPGFYQGHKNTTTLQPAFRGQALMVLGDFIVGDFNEQKDSGFFYVDVKIKPKMRFKIGHLKTTKYSPKEEDRQKDDS